MAVLMLGNHEDQSSDHNIKLLLACEWSTACRDFRSKSSLLSLLSLIDRALLCTTFIAMLPPAGAGRVVNMGKGCMVMTYCDGLWGSVVGLELGLMSRLCVFNMSECCMEHTHAFCEKIPLRSPSGRAPPEHSSTPLYRVARVGK